MSQVCRHSFERKSNNALFGGDDNEEEVCRLCGKDRNHVLHVRKEVTHGFDAPPGEVTKDTPCILCGEVLAHDLHWSPHVYVSSSTWIWGWYWGCTVCGMEVGSSVHTATPTNPFVKADTAQAISFATDSADFTFDFLQRAANSDPAKLAEGPFLISLASGLERLSQDCKFFLGQAGELTLIDRFRRLLTSPRVAGNKFASMLIHAAAAVASQHLVSQNQNEFKGETFFEISLLQALKLFVEIEPVAIDMFAKFGARAPYFCINNYLLTRVCFSGPMSKILSPEAQQPFGNNALSVVFIVLRFVLLLGTKPKIESGSFTDVQYFISQLFNMGGGYDNQKPNRKFPEYVDGIVKDLQPERLVEPIHKIVRLAVIRPACPAASAGKFVPVLGSFCSSFHSLVNRFNQLPSKRQFIMDFELSHQYTGFWLAALEAVDSIDLQKAFWLDAMKNFSKLGICDRLQDIAYLLWQSTNDSSLRSIAFSVFNDEKGKIGPFPFPSKSVSHFFALADDITNPVYDKRHFKLLQKWTESVIKRATSTHELSSLAQLFNGIVQLKRSNRAASLLEGPFRYITKTLWSSFVPKEQLDILITSEFSSVNGNLVIFIGQKIMTHYGTSFTTSSTLNDLLVVMCNFLNRLSPVRHWSSFPEALKDANWCKTAASKMVHEILFLEPSSQSVSAWIKNPMFDKFPINDLVVARVHGSNDNVLRPTMICGFFSQLVRLALKQTRGTVTPAELEDAMGAATRRYDNDPMHRGAIFCYIDLLVGELLENRKVAAHFVGKNKDIAPILSSSPHDVLALLPDAKVEGFGSKSIDQFIRKSTIDEQFFVMLRCECENALLINRQSLLKEETGEFEKIFLSFTMISSELDKFNWFRLACHSLNLEFPAEFSKEKIIQMLEAELLYKKEFLDVTDQTLKACGFPGAIINRLRKVIDHLSSASSFSSPAVLQLLDEVKSQLPGVLVLPPAEIGLKKHRDSKLGAGGYGDVYKATIISQRNRRCAAKIFYDKNIAIQEARNLFHLHHPNVVQLIAVTVEDAPNPSVVLLSERADSDFSRLIGSTQPVSEARHYAEQIARGLNYLHQVDRANEKSCIVHLDIKPENILVFRIGSSITLKISDLGFAHEMESSTTTEKSNFAATERYLSPETRIDRRKCRKNSNHNVRIFRAIDIFSFGIILLQMIAPTWYKRHGRERIQTKIDDVFHNDSLLQSNECCIDDFTSEVGDCDDLVQLVKDCLMINIKNRPQNGAALLQRLSSGAAAQDFDVVNDSSDDSSSSSDDVNDESGSDENDDEGIPQTGRKQGSIKRSTMKMMNK